MPYIDQCRYGLYSMTNANMAYVGMACMVMTNSVVSNVVMAYIVTTNANMAYLVMVCTVMVRASWVM